MSPNFSAWDDPTFELAVERFTAGTDEGRRAELDQKATAADLEEFEAVLAAIHLGSLDMPEEPPAELLDRLENLGRMQVGQDARPSRESEDAPSGSLLSFAGWFAAAAAVAGLSSTLTLTTDRSAS